MEVSTILWIAGIGIAGGVYACVKPKSAKKEFIKNKEAFMSLIRKMSTQFDKGEWLDAIVTLNNKTIYNWWKNLICENGSSNENLESSLRAFLKECGITVPTHIVENQTKPAKDAFVENISLFKPLLIDLHMKSMDPQIWQEAIVTTNNKELLDYWKKVKGNASSWLTILQMWGIKFDTCQSFVCIDSYKDLYETRDGTLLENGKKYIVESPCWILTKTDEHGKTSKEIILKGTVYCN